MKTAMGLTLILILLSLDVMAKVQLFNTTPVSFPAFHFRAIASLTKDKMNKVLLQGVQETNTASEVIGKVSDNAVQDWLASDEMQGSTLVQSSKSLEKSMKQEVSFGGKGPNAIGHKLTFQYLAFQSVARMNYVGYLNALVDYDTRNQKTIFEVNEKFSGNKDIYLNSSATNLEYSSSLGVRWKW